MPFYEYQCKACGHQLEAMQKISDKPLKKCPNCNKQQLAKLISATSFQLKGTGWYVTDFKDKPKKEAPKKEGATADVSKEAKKPEKVKKVKDKASD